MSRVQLTGDTTFYLCTTGSDSNDGLSAATPWSGDINGAFARILNGYYFDGGGGHVYLQLADGAYSGGIHYAGSPATPNNTIHLQVQGNASDPYAVTVGSPDANSPAVGVYTHAVLSLANLRIGPSGSGAHGVSMRRGACLTLNGGIDFMGASQAHCKIETGSVLAIEGDYTISGGAPSHLMLDCGGMVYNSTTRNIGFRANSDFPSGFVSIIAGSVARLQWMTFFANGYSITGKRFDCGYGGTIHTGSGNANYLPGNAAGDSSHGFYV